MAKKANRKAGLVVEIPMAAGEPWRQVVLRYALSGCSQKRLVALARELGVAIPKYKDDLVERLVMRLWREEFGVVVKVSDGDE